MNTKLNRFLQTRQEVDVCTQFIKENNLVPHPLDCKNWDMAMLAPLLKDNDLIDLGADGSHILHNKMKRGLTGKAVGIDLLGVPEHNRAEGAEYFTGDLMATPFESESFDTATCLSVIEHQVLYDAFAKEASRLLRKGGELFVTFDYAPKKIDTSLTKLYSLDWNILSREDAEKLISVCAEHGLQISSEVDWTTNEMVINNQFCSPVQGVHYTFGLFHFIKQ